MNKRGLSDIVTNVLIILLVLVAVGIIWFFVWPLIFGGSSQLDRIELIYGADLSIVEGSAIYNPLDGQVQFSVRRESDGADLNAINVVLDYVNGDNLVVKADVDLDIFETQLIEVTGIPGELLARISIAPIVIGENGNEILGEITDSYDFPTEGDLNPQTEFECNDGISNDLDGLIDEDDPGCWDSGAYDPDDDSEEDTLDVCSNFFDDDGDGLIDWGFTDENDPFCSSPFDDSENNIADFTTVQWKPNWDDFPEFSGPSSIPVVYGGVHLDDYQGWWNSDFGNVPLRRGFTHLVPDSVSAENAELIPKNQRAVLFFPLRPSENYNPQTQPWFIYKSPWENDLEGVIIPSWEEQMVELADMFPDTQGTGNPNINITIHDIERKWDRDDRILALKYNSNVPMATEIRELNDDEFIERYKRDMGALYEFTLRWFEDNGYNIGSQGLYGDTPIKRVIYPYQQSWNDWTNDYSLIDYTYWDFTSNDQNWNQTMGPMWNTIDIQAPSPYYFPRHVYPRDAYPYATEDYDLPSGDDLSTAGKYLAYLLFQSDVTSEWDSGKPQMNFVWPLIHSNGDVNRNISYTPTRHTMHATAIFSYFVENPGVWLWDWTGYNDRLGIYPYLNDEVQFWRMDNYDGFIYGLYRISLYKEMFEGNYNIYIPKNPRDQSFNRDPIWRGVANNGQLLVVAHNPFAQLDETTTFEIDYYDVNLGTITTEGLNVEFKTFSLSGLPECSNGEDDDGDGFQDIDDSGCTSWDGDSESSPSGSPLFI